MEDITTLDFPTALKFCLEGKRISNLGWNGKDMYVYAVEGRNYKNTKCAPYLMMFNAQGEYVPWVPSTGDIFSKKWIVLED